MYRLHCTTSQRFLIIASILFCLNSGEEDDLLDTFRMKDHLSRDNNKKRATLQAQKLVAEEQD